MYDELVKRLRSVTTLPVMNALCQEAADAIERLQYFSVFWQEAAKMAHENELKWIPVTERLPDSGVCVLVTDGLEVGEGWITEIINTKGHFSRWCAPTADIDIDRRPITHWMPLPEPPKEE